MGCGASAAPKTQPGVAAQPPPAPPTATPVQKFAHGGGPDPSVGDKAGQKFQIMLSGNWSDYGPDEDAVLKRAYLVGQPNVRFALRGQKYEYNFTDMTQKNLDTNKERRIRPPPKMKPPAAPLLPTGPMVVITVPPGSAGQTITINDPNNPGQQMQVNVPPNARPGQKMAVPVPEAGQSVEEVSTKQKKHMTAGAIAGTIGGVAVVAGGLAVGGVILGDHLSGGAVADAAAGALGDGAGDAIGSVTGFAAGAAGDIGGAVGDAAADAGLTDVAGDAAAAAADAAGDFGDVAGDFGGAAGDWLGDAAGDAGDFVMSLF
mmetsp:Transcript_7568/g.14003  ORF Transcript_7568/g.14003 Transcript_7568/m.14003 type:complete len:317 (+) Transcript_7568:59-1009(+)|eukprot:CAMPEP_0172830358 /NCGR_PEP_ID=MMETSP1075-20121228/22196_1 /TAXON_ID=2916 /ORGANISM="Ceratium fusus, Strain PA161109" /LENGTH=316 /DNA_ID=CAMNT_0013672641 /DNA_START=36 /DNA_END=986 /DNA_ORIENTATION=+